VSPKQYLDNFLLILNMIKDKKHLILVLATIHFLTIV
jgi:hypothetical protein